MNYKPPKSPVFWVPVPDTGQSRIDLIDWKYTPGTAPPRMVLTDPDTGDYTVEILDYLGPYSIGEIPDHLARQIINAEATGRILAKLLTGRVTEFKNCKKLFFYQVNPIVTNG